MNKQHQANTGYQEKTERINAWSRIGSLTVKLVWTFVIVIVLASLGNYLSVKDTPSMKEDTSIQTPREKPIIEPMDWHEIDQAIVDGLIESRVSSEKLASAKLEAWVTKLMVRVDDDFLGWYFGYWNQQIMGLKALWHSGYHWVDGDHPTASEKITETVQEQFAKRVLRPQIAQMELERVTREVVNHYTISLRNTLNEIPKTYNVPTKDWEAHLEDLAIISSTIEGNREVALSLKAVATSTAAGTVVFAKALTPAFKAMGSKVSAKMAGKAAAKMATKTGAKVAAKAGGKLLGPIVGVGIMIWDLWDHNATRDENKPILRKNIQDYLYEMKDVLLHDTESGVMSVIYTVEGNVVDAL